MGSPISATVGGGGMYCNLGEGFIGWQEICGGGYSHTHTHFQSRSLSSKLSQIRMATFCLF